MPSQQRTEQCPFSFTLAVSSSEQLRAALDLQDLLLRAVMWSAQVGVLCQALCVDTG